MIAIIDYGVGNIFSLASSFKAIGAEVIVTSDEDIIRNSAKIVLPGVGAFADAARKLDKLGISTIIKEEAKKGKHILGICLGMQLLFEKSFEYGKHSGLSLIRGEITPISDFISPELKTPHIGWNSLNFPEYREKSELFKYVNEGEYVYFVHSYSASNCKDAIIATSKYGVDLTAAVAYENIFGCQFHPEKSGTVGINILRAFCEIGE